MTALMPLENQADPEIVREELRRLGWRLVNPAEWAQWRWKIPLERST